MIKTRKIIITVTIFLADLLDLKYLELYKCFYCISFCKRYTLDKYIFRDKFY